jgi:hypothetical protein
MRISDIDAGGPPLVFDNRPPRDYTLGRRRRKTAGRLPEVAS